MEMHEHNGRSPESGHEHENVRRAERARHEFWKRRLLERWFEPS